MAQRHRDPAGGYGDGGGSPWPEPVALPGTVPGTDRSGHEPRDSCGEAPGTGRVLVESHVPERTAPASLPAPTAPTAPTARTAPADGSGRDVLAAYLHAQAADFLRSLRLHRAGGADAEEAVEAARRLRRSARRISGALHIFRPLTDAAWADPFRAELGWLSGTLAREHTYTARLDRLRTALHRLAGADTGPYGAAHDLGAYDGGYGYGSGFGGRADAAWSDLFDGFDGFDGTAPVPGGRAEGAEGAETGAAPGGDDTPPADAPRPPAARSAPAARAASVRGGDGTGTPKPRTGPARRGPGDAAPAALTVGAARAGALLERQLTLARTRAHSAALQALGSSRFHAVADAVAVLASEVPLDGAACDGPAGDVLGPLVDAVHERLVVAVEMLPLYRAGHPYNAEALVHGLAATAAADAPPATEQQDAPWHQVRLLVRLRRYGQEVLDPVDLRVRGGDEPSLGTRLLSAAHALDRHRDASEAAAAAAAAARTPRISPATAYALGVLHADQRHDVEAARYAFGRLWQRMAVSV
ncbi:CHAD domain-containing protein [Streptomyces sp. NPDC048639]|uniref:CHAD domain-containing protein n=1 Tax=Streptomyces sp. NPDC048639 TaxID=3365581 RepID=UPI00371E30F7